MVVESIGVNVAIFILSMLIINKRKLQISIADAIDHVFYTEFLNVLIILVMIL